MAPPNGLRDSLVCLEGARQPGGTGERHFAGISLELRKLSENAAIATTRALVLSMSSGERCVRHGYALEDLCLRITANKFSTIDTWFRIRDNGCSHRMSIEIF